MTKNQHRLAPLIQSRSAGSLFEQILLAADGLVLVVRQVEPDS